MARKLTLGQATGGRPAPIARRPQQPAQQKPAPAPPRPTRQVMARPPQTPQPPPAPRLGLGLGLGAQQRGNFQQAVQQGNASQYLGAHPGLQQRMSGFAHPNSQFMQARANFLTSGQSQRPGPRGAPGSDVMPQPPPAMPQAPPSASFQTPQSGSLGMVGGDMQGQNAGGYGYNPDGSFGNPATRTTAAAQAGLFNQSGPYMGGQTSGGYGYQGQGGGYQAGGQIPQQSGNFQPAPYTGLGNTGYGMQGSAGNYGGGGQQLTGPYGGFGGQAAQRGQQMYGRGMGGYLTGYGGGQQQNPYAGGNVPTPSGGGGNPLMSY